MKRGTVYTENVRNVKVKKREIRKLSYERWLGIRNEVDTYETSILLISNLRIKTEIFKVDFETISNVRFNRDKSQKNNLYN